MVEKGVDSKDNEIDNDSNDTSFEEKERKITKEFNETISGLSFIL